VFVLCPDHTLMAQSICLHGRRPIFFKKYLCSGTSNRR
jgi:hypothetical protein